MDHVLFEESRANLTGSIEIVSAILLVEPDVEVADEIICICTNHKVLWIAEDRTVWKVDCRLALLVCVNHSIPNADTSNLHSVVGRYIEASNTFSHGIISW